MTAITCIHPSRDRAIRCHGVAQNWLFNSSGQVRIQYIVSIDTDDKQADEYRRRLTPQGITVVQNPNRSMVDAVNAPIPMIEGEIVVVVSDDFECPKDWDLALLALRPESSLYAIHVDDCYSYPDRLLTIPILSTAAVAALGYIYKPVYFSMFADNDLYEVCDKHFEIVDGGALKFPHLHPTKGLNPEDATYRRQNSAMAWQTGERTFKQRKLEGFPI